MLLFRCELPLPASKPPLTAFSGPLSPSHPTTLPSSTPSPATPHSAPCPVCAQLADRPCSSCTQNFCPRHLFDCPDCQLSLCASCFDLHNLDGHWSDSDTAAALAACSPSLAANPRHPGTHNHHTPPTAPTAQGAATNPSLTQLHKAESLVADVLPQELHGLPPLAAAPQTAPATSAIATTARLPFRLISQRSFTFLATTAKLLFHRISPPSLSSLTTAAKVQPHRISPSLTSLPTTIRLLLRRISQPTFTSLTSAINRLLLRLKLLPGCRSVSGFPATAAEAGQ